MTDTLKFAVGDIVRITDNKAGHPFAVGQEVRIVKTFPDSPSPHYGAEALGEKGDVWYFGDADCEPARRFVIGDTVTLRSHFDAIGDEDPSESCWPHFMGKRATVTGYYNPDSDGTTITVEWEDSTDDKFGIWHERWFDKVEDDEAPGRPLVHFDDEKAGRDRSKAREACSEAISTSLKDDHNIILGQAANGESVDAYALNAAITAAIRSASTRRSASTQRAEMAKRFAHVAHIVQAVLENHADNLPGYEPGARSRLLTEAHAGIAEAKRALDEAMEQRERMAEEARMLREEIDTLRSNLGQTVREANENEAAINWLVSKGQSKQEREGFRRAIDAFIDGFRSGASDD